MPDPLDDYAFAAACEAAPAVDPEDVRRIVDAYLADLRRAVERMAEAAQPQEPKP